MGYRVAVVGATGNVGREMLNILEEVNFPVDKIHAIASRKSIGVEVNFGDQIVRCEDIEQFDFSRVTISTPIRSEKGMPVEGCGASAMMGPFLAERGLRSANLAAISANLKGR